MRKIDILNKQYEKLGLDTVVYTNKTIDEVVYIDSDGTEFTLRDIFEKYILTANDITSVSTALVNVDLVG
ncbi:MAG: hypothetical protein PF487_13355, partial [Bacteroidales bacterium]|nr:hypothetical protein [Bacteroidales bacterium]